MAEERRVSRREAVRRVGTMSLVSFLAQPSAQDLFANALPYPISIPAGAPDTGQTFVLNQSVIALDSGQDSYVKFAARDLADYLKDITGTDVPIRMSLDENAKSLVVRGDKMGQQVVGDVFGDNQLGEQGFLIKSSVKDGKSLLTVAGPHSKGTNHGVAHLMKMIHSEGKTAYLQVP